jgi:hypothetical protein
MIKEDFHIGVKRVLSEEEQAEVDRIINRVKESERKRGRGNYRADAKTLAASKKKRMERDALMEQTRKQVS